MSADAKLTRKLRYTDFARLPDDGQRHEILDGEHFVNPAPSTYHQTISRRLLHQLYTQIELRDLGVVYNAPVDVVLSEFDIVEPDLLVILNARKSLIGPANIQGAPDLVVEILSPSTIRNDRQLKKDLYQRSGVTEYWIVDPIARSIEQYVLREGIYELQLSTEELRLSIVEGIWFSKESIW